MNNQDFVEETAKNIIDSLKNGTAPWVKPWKAEELNDVMPYNPITGKKYLGINSINLMLRGYNDPRWLTYKQAQSIKAQVKKGEKSTLIQYWQFNYEKNELDEKGNPVLDEKGKPKKIVVLLDQPRVYYANVFNATQIENMPKLEKTNKIDIFKRNELAEKILKNSNAVIKHDSNSAYYSPINDEIHLPKKEAFFEEGGYYTVALHELGHWTGHKSRLNRDLNHAFGTKGYAKEELRAEIASFLFNSKIGLNHNPENHISYIDSWIQILEDKPTEIFKATSDATKIVTYIEDLAIEKTKNQDIKTEKTVLNTVENIATEKTVLNVPYIEKDEAKKYGAKWDKDSKTWYAPKGVDLNNFTPWLKEKNKDKTIDKNLEKINTNELDSKKNNIDNFTKDFLKKVHVRDIKISNNSKQESSKER